VSVIEGDYDVAIAGGGMVGVSLALCLRRRLGGQARILLVESFALPPRDSNFHRRYSASFDARSTALSYGSCLIYRELGLWSALEERACAIERIHVSEQGRFGSTLMRAADYGWPALGYVLENAWLGNVLVQALHGSDLETLSPEKVVSATAGDRGAVLRLESGRTLAAALLVVADGARSELRGGLGIDVERRDYGQVAVVANVAHAEPHRGVAYERFTARGPLAMLPLPDEGEDIHRSALVWSLSTEEARHFSRVGEEEFLAGLRERFGYRLGRLSRVGERHSYPLSLMEAREQVRSHVVVMGNAAHSLHPVAGQGFNLALRDVACLGAVLAEARRQGLSPGRLEVLQRYAARRQSDQRRTTGFSDRLPGLFMHRHPALGLLRDIGMFALDVNPALKREFVRHAAGVGLDYRDV